MRTPAEQAIYNAERPIYAVAAALDKYTAMLATLRAGLAKVILPAAVANDHLDFIDDLLAIADAKLDRATSHVGKKIEQLQDAEQARYDATPEDEATARERELIEFQDAHARPANDDLATLVNKLRAGGRP